MGASLLFGGASCEEAEAEKPEKEQEQANLPPANVNLPPVPDDLGESKIPLTYADGALTVDGLRRQRMKHLDQTVKVRGTIDFIYDCEYWDQKKLKKYLKKMKKEGKDVNSAMCERAHLYVIDKGEKENRLLVAGLPEDFPDKIKKKKYTVGQEITFEGQYTDAGDSFVAPDLGLIVVEKFHGEDAPVIE